MKLKLGMAVLIIATTSQAQNTPFALSTDARIKQVRFQDNNVIPVQGMTFTTTQIQFAYNERVLGIEGGDTTAWMVTYHPELANMVFVKPTMFDSNTNMTIITDKHAYYFHLISNKKLEKKTTEQTYALKFTYVEPKPTVIQTSIHTKTNLNQANHPINSTKINTNSLQLNALNTAYRFSGSPQLVPVHVFDDGQFTYFELSANAQRSPHFNF